MHDATGAPLKKGDRVVVEFEVSEASATDDYCNVLLKPVRPFHPSADRFEPVAWFNARQTVKVGP